MNSKSGHNTMNNKNDSSSMNSNSINNSNSSRGKKRSFDALRREDEERMHMNDEYKSEYEHNAKRLLTEDMAIQLGRLNLSSSSTASSSSSSSSSSCKQLALIYSHNNNNNNNNNSDSCCGGNNDDTHILKSLYSSHSLSTLLSKSHISSSTAMTPHNQLVPYRDYIAEYMHQLCCKEEQQQIIQRTTTTNATTIAAATPATMADSMEDDES